MLSGSLEGGGGEPGLLLCTGELLLRQRCVFFAFPNFSSAAHCACLRDLGSHRFSSLQLSFASDPQYLHTFVRTQASDQCNAHHTENCDYVSIRFSQARLPPHAHICQARCHRTHLASTNTLAPFIRTSGLMMSSGTSIIFDLLNVTRQLTRLDSNEF